MSINYAILGLLTWKNFTGYEIKKYIKESELMYWSGNNNQIYKALVKLLDEGCVSNVVEHQDGSPSKKIYSITEKGKEYLKKWLLSDKKIFQMKNNFLIQFAWMDILSYEELDKQLEKYENNIKTNIMMYEEKQRRGIREPRRSKREKVLWNQISENILSSYKNQLKWVKKTRNELKLLNNE